jgi:hypothetical protein
VPLTLTVNVTEAPLWMDWEAGLLVIVGAVPNAGADTEKATELLPAK